MPLNEERLIVILSDAPEHVPCAAERWVRGRITAATAAAVGDGLAAVVAVAGDDGLAHAAAGAVEAARLTDKRLPSRARNYWSDGEVGEGGVARRRWTQDTSWPSPEVRNRNAAEAMLREAAHVHGARVLYVKAAWSKGGRLGEGKADELADLARRLGLAVEEHAVPADALRERPHESKAPTTEEVYRVAVEGGDVEQVTLVRYHRTAGDEWTGATVATGLHRSPYAAAAAGAPLLRFARGAGYRAVVEVRAPGEPLASELLARVEAAEAELRKRPVDDPECDGTHGAHPAWRRGVEHGQSLRADIIERLKRAERALSEVLAECAERRLLKTDDALEVTGLGFEEWSTFVTRAFVKGPRVASPYDDAAHLQARVAFRAAEQRLVEAFALLGPGAEAMPDEVARVIDERPARVARWLRRSQVVSQKPDTQGWYLAEGPHDAPKGLPLLESWLRRVRRFPVAPGARPGLLDLLGLGAKAAEGLPVASLGSLVAGTETAQLAARNALFERLASLGANLKGIVAGAVNLRVDLGRPWFIGPLEGDPGSGDGVHVLGPDDAPDKPGAPLSKDPRRWLFEWLDHEFSAGVRVQNLRDGVTVLRCGRRGGPAASCVWVVSTVEAVAPFAFDKVADEAGCGEGPGHG